MHGGPPWPMDYYIMEIYVWNSIKFFNFTDSFRRWIKFLNTDIEASVIQASVKPYKLEEVVKREIP